MKTLLNLTLTLIAYVFAIFQSNAQADVSKTFDQNIPQILTQQKVPGAAVAIIKNGKVVFEKGYGFSDVNAQTPVNEKTGFNIGSISKTFTVWGVLKLVEQGKIDLEASVFDYISTYNLPNSTFSTSDVTVKNLLQHTAGLSVHGYNGYENASDLTNTRASLKGETTTDEKVELIIEPGTKWQYSGGGYTLLQLLIEEVSGLTFAQFMEEEVFKPLHMKNSSFDIDVVVLKTSAKGYDEEGNEIPLRLFNAKAAAGLHTTLEDLILFVKASFNNNAVLTKQSLDLMMQPTELSRGNYGMGYMVMNRFGDITLTGHGGSNEGWQAGFMLDVKTNSGIVILTNGSAGRNVIFKGIQDWVQWHSNN